MATHGRELLAIRARDTGLMAGPYYALRFSAGRRLHNGGSDQSGRADQRSPHNPASDAGYAVISWLPWRLFCYPPVADEEKSKR